MHERNQPEISRELHGPAYVGPASAGPSPRRCRYYRIDVVAPYLIIFAHCSCLPIDAPRHCRSIRSFSLGPSVVSGGGGRERGADVPFHVGGIRPGPCSIQPGPCSQGRSRGRIACPGKRFGSCMHDRVSRPCKAPPNLAGLLSLRVEPASTRRPIDFLNEGRLEGQT
jgi:hypothetical protein